MSSRGTRRPATASLWRNRDFMILWTGETVSGLGTSMSFFVFPLIGYSLSGSTVEAAFAGSAFALGSVAAKLPAGVLVDRWDRKRVLVASNALGALLYASLVLALWVDRLTLAHLVAVALASGVVASFFGPAETASIRRVVPPEELPTAFSQNQMRYHAANLAGPPLGGALYSVARWVPFLVDTVTYLLSAFALARIRTPLPPPDRLDRSVTTMRHDIAEGVRYLWSRGVLRAIVLFASLANFAVEALFLVLTLKLLRAGVAPAAIGLIDTIAAVAGLVGSVVAPALIRRMPSGLLAIGFAMVLVVVVVPMAYTNSVPVIGGLLAVAMLGNPAGNACIMSYLVATVPDRLQGRTQSALGFLAGSLMPLAPLLGGALLVLIGGRGATLTVSGLTALSVLPLLLSREVRGLPTPDSWPGTVNAGPVGAPAILDI
jgi:predicted MFS family arabinose efflux permease